MRPEAPGAVGVGCFLKMPVAVFAFTETYQCGEIHIFGLRSHSASAAYENRIYLQVNLNEPRRDSRRGSLSGQLGGVMWNASARSTSAFC